LIEAADFEVAALDASRHVGVFVRPAQRRGDVERPSSRFDDRQDVGAQRIADHEETIRRDAAAGENPRVDVGRLVADDLDEAKAIAQARAFHLRRLMQQIALGDQHQRAGRRETGQRLLGGGEQLDVFGEHLLGELYRPPKAGARNPAIRDLDRRLDEREHEARDAIAVVRQVDELGPIHTRFDFLRAEIDARVRQQPPELLAPVTIAALVVPERIVAVECDQVEGAPCHERRL